MTPSILGMWDIYGLLAHDTLRLPTLGLKKTSPITASAQLPTSIAPLDRPRVP